MKKEFDTLNKTFSKIKKRLDELEDIITELKDVEVYKKVPIRVTYFGRSLVEVMAAYDSNTRFANITVGTFSVDCWENGNITQDKKFTNLNDALKFAKDYIVG